MSGGARYLCSYRAKASSTVRVRSVKPFATVPPSRLLAMVFVDDALAARV
jgi:hypothetical protein